MPDEKSEVKKISAQIQGGFYPQTAPLVKGATMAEEKKRQSRRGIRSTWPAAQTRQQGRQRLRPAPASKETAGKAG